MDFGSNGQFILKLGSLLLAASLWLLGLCEYSLLNNYVAKANILFELILSVA